MLYEIKSNEATAVIDSNGAMLVSLKDSSGTEYIWQRDDKYWDESCPILFPVIGRLKDGYYTFNNEKYTCPLHGFAKHREFYATQQSDNEIIFTLKSDEETQKYYPFKFEFHVGFILDRKNLTCYFHVINDDDKTMYFALGGHPGFACPLNPEESFSDYKLIFDGDKEFNSCIIDENFEISIEEKKTIPSDNGTINLDYSLFIPDALVFDDLNSDTVTLINEKTQKGVKIEFTQFSSLGIWTLGKEKAPFICIEPWFGSGMRKGENHELSKKHNILHLDRAEEFLADFTITII